MSENGKIVWTPVEQTDWGKPLGGATGENVFGDKMIVTKWEKIEIIYCKNTPKTWTVTATQVADRSNVATARMTDAELIGHIERCYDNPELLAWARKANEDYGKADNA